MSRPRLRWELLPVLGILLVALVLPVGAVLLRSFQVRQVTTHDGRVLRAVGEVEEGPASYVFAVQSGAGADRIPVRLAKGSVARVETVFSLDHYRIVLSDARTHALVLHSVVLALGAVLAALLLGLPVAWLLGRTDLPGRRVLAALCLGPAILPPLVVAMGAARPLGDALHGLLGLGGEALQLVAAMIVFGLVFFPVVALLVGRALAAVPVGPYEAARLLGGRRAALRHVVWPAISPAILGACVLVFVLALSDFTVPNVLGFVMPQVTTPTNVFPTEILLQWKHQGNTGRAVATGAPLLLFTALLVLLSLRLLGRSPLVAGGEGRQGRPPVVLGGRGRVVGWLVLALVLGVSLVLPLGGVASWGLGSGVTVANPGVSLPAPPAAATTRTGLFDVAGSLANTPGWEDDLLRWLKSGIAAAFLATALAVVLARWAVHGGRLARGVVLALGAAPLAVPGLVFTVGTLAFWVPLHAEWAERGILRSVLVLAARFLPFALAAAWLALREVRRGQEEAGAVLGAPALVRATRIWGPLAARGILGGGLLVLLLALRETDAVMLVDARIFPMRLFDKIHYSRLADEANLAFLYVGILLVPAVLAALVLGRRRGAPRRFHPEATDV